VYLLLVSHLLGRYMILVIFTTLVEPFLIPLPEVVVCFLNKDADRAEEIMREHIQSFYAKVFKIISI